MYGLSEESLTIVGIILIIVGVAMIGWGFEWNQDITNDKRVGTVVRDIGVMVLATGIIFVRHDFSYFLILYMTNYSHYKTKLS